MVLKSIFKPQNNWTSFLIHNLKVEFIVFLAITTVTTGVSIWIPWYLELRKANEIFTRRSINVFTEQVRMHINSLNEENINTLSALKLYLSSIEDRKILSNGSSYFIEYENFLLSQLSLNPYTTWLQIGFPNGDFIGGQRISAETLQLHIRTYDRIYNGESATTETVKYYTIKEGKLTFLEEKTSLMNNPYYAPNRPWYKAAKGGEGRPKRVVYQYASDNTLGMDTSMEVNINSTESLVIAIGIKLEILLQNINSIKEIYPETEVFIADDQNKLIASSNPQNSLEDQENEANTLTNFVMEETSEFLKEHKKNISLHNPLNPYEIKYHNKETREKYIISLIPTGFSEWDNGWIVGIIIPENIFQSGNIKRNILIILSLVVLLISLVAISLGNRMVIKPILEITDVAKLFETGEKNIRVSVKSQNEIGILGDSFNKMANTINRSFQELEEAKLQLEMSNQDLEKKVSERTEELREIAQEAKSARIEAEAANATKSMFLANMSHELRTPLNAIIGYSEMLIEDAEDLSLDDFTPDLEKIRRSGKLLLALINDLLDLSKIEAGKMDLYLESFSLDEIIEDIIITIDPLIKRNNNQFIFENKTSNIMMNADLTKLRQSIINLLSNAFKFTHDGKVYLTIESYLHESREWIRFIVKDTGIGLSSEQMNKLFQPFVQADSSTTRKYGGTGLGLALSRKFCQLHGGDILIESEIGKGSSFIIVLPISAIIKDNP